MNELCWVCREDYTTRATAKNVVLVQLRQYRGRPIHVGCLPWHRNAILSNLGFALREEMTAFWEVGLVYA